MKVLVTGSASPLALALLPTLAADERLEQIIGVDRTESTYTDPRFTQIILDPQSPQLARVIAQVDAVVHLASAAALDAPADAQRDRARFRSLCLESGQNVMRGAIEHRIRCVVHVSSSAVYALPPRERPMTEQHPLAPLPGFAWAEDLVALEDWLDALNADDAGVRLVRLRPAHIVGRRASPFVEALLGGFFTIRFGGRQPRLQCVHVEDLASAIVKALTHKDAGGAFNLACHNATTLAHMQQLRGRGVLPLPYPVVYRLQSLTARDGVGAAWMEALRHDVVLDSDRARRRLGWKPAFDSVEACLKAERKEVAHG